MSIFSLDKDIKERLGDYIISAIIYEDIDSCDDFDFTVNIVISQPYRLQLIHVINIISDVAHIIIDYMSNINMTCSVETKNQVRFYYENNSMYIFKKPHGDDETVYYSFPLTTIQYVNSKDGMYDELETLLYDITKNNL